MSDEEARRVKRERCAEQIERYRRTPDLFPVVVFNAGPDHQPHCGAAAQLDKQYLDEPPMLPLEACDRPRCFCSWRGVSKFELRRREVG